MRNVLDCVDGNMLIAMYDNTVKKIKDVKKGDAIISVQYDGDDYRYIKGEVTSINRRRGRAFKITLSDGRNLISSPNHQWLTKSGWHFTFFDDTLSAGKVYLREGITMSGLTGALLKQYSVTKHYMEGYFLGAEAYGKNLVSMKSGEIAEFAFQEAEVTSRIYNYLLYFDADVTIEDCFAHDKDTNEYYITKKLNISYKQLISLSEKFSKDRDKEEFIRGFVAGVYDSDGTVNPIVKKLNSSKKEYLMILKKGLDSYDFEFEYDSKDRTTSLLGGPSELMRFYHIFNPITTCKLENVVINDRHPERLKITSIQEVRCDELVELTTTTRNFLANGIISHNCTTGMVKEV